MEASKKYRSLQNLLDLDVANGTVRTSGSHSRNLRRVRQGLDLIRALFEQFLSNEYVPFLFYIAFYFVFPTSAIYLRFVPFNKK